MPNYSAIPLELRAIPQWIVWRMEDVGASKPSKVPFNARTGHLSSVTDPSTWSTFEECLSVVENYSGIGFVFTENDPYSFIDLDNTNGDQTALNIQLKIFNEFDSYSEISPSGKGLHIIVKGKVKVGRRRSFIEIYSSQRYATMTGNVYHNKPINDQQEKLSQLWEQMGGGTPKTNLYHGDSIEKLKDADIIAQALKALNGDKFKILNEGRWQELYQSQSEADFAYIDILAFYTQNKSQIMRLFRSSALGKRDKAKRNDYLSWMIERSFDRMLPQLDFDGFKIALDNKLNEQQLELKIGASKEPSRSIVPADIPVATPTLPPGLLGELAQFIYAAAPRPVPEIALAGAIGLMAGITGRAYNVSGTGLNQYVLLLAQTGCHAAGTPILMYDGSIKNVEDVKVNDLLMGPNSGSRTVLNLARGFETLYKVIPTKGDAFIINENHILSLVHTQGRKRTNISILDWLKKTKQFKHCHKLERKSVNFYKTNKLPLDPWFLGAMLGDGCFIKVPMLTSQDECIRNKAKLIIEKMGMKVVTSQVPGNAAFQDRYIQKIRDNTNSLRFELEMLGLWNKRSATKFIPQIYKTSLRESRLAILAGLLDTDGNLTKGNTYDYISKSKYLADDVVFIARSLGYAAYVKPCEKFSQLKTGGTYYRVSISGNLNELPMVLKYKKATIRKQKKDVLVTGFKIEKLTPDNYYGFSLNGDHLYLTGDFTVHHNTGKEQIASGIDKLMNAIRFQVPTSISFIGPSEIASGQALIKYLYSKSQSFVCVLGEFGLRLQQMSNQNANSAEVSLRRMLLDLFNKSGHGQVVRPSIYSDKDKNTDLINSPAFSILGESTPERFYGALNEEMISEGLLPRFTLIEYNGLRPALNPDHQKATPSFSLIEKLATLAAQAETINHANPRRVINVVSSSEAEKILYDFDKYADTQINGTTKDVVRQLWNRAHIKVLKLSGLVAVGCNLADPIIQAEHVQWSIDMIQNDIRRLSEKFDAGEIGMATSESKQTSEIIRVIREYVTRPWDYICKYVDTKRLFDDKVIPYAYISRRLMALGCFRADKAGATNSIKRAIQVLIDSDKLREISKSDLATKYGTTQRSFIISNINILN